jgi:putative FmdB family regulatory protein
MPIYEYRCRKCGEVTEALQRMGDRPLRKCPRCSGRLEKIVSRTAFLLKGGGWFAEGYSKNGGKSKKNGSGSSDAPKSDSTKKSSGSAKGATGAAATP